MGSSRGEGGKKKNVSRVLFLGPSQSARPIVGPRATAEFFFYLFVLPAGAVLARLRLNRDLRSTFYRAFVETDFFPLDEETNDKKKYERKVVLLECTAFCPNDLELKLILCRWDIQLCGRSSNQKGRKNATVGALLYLFASK